MAGKNRGAGTKECESVVHGNDAHADGITCQAGDVVDVEGLHQLAAIGLGRLGADAQVLGNLLGRVPFRDQLEYFALARCQTFQRRQLLTDPPKAGGNDVSRDR